MKPRALVLCLVLAVILICLYIWSSKPRTIEIGDSQSSLIDIAGVKREDEAKAAAEAEARRIAAAKQKEDWLKAKAEAEEKQKKRLAEERPRVVLANTWLFMPRADDRGVAKVGRANRLMAFAADGTVSLGRSATEHRITFVKGLLEMSSEDGAAWMRFAPETDRDDCNWYCDRKANQPAQHEYSARLVLVKEDIGKLRARLKSALETQAGLEAGLAEADANGAKLPGMIQRVEEDIRVLRNTPLPPAKGAAAQNNVRKRRQEELDKLQTGRTNLIAKLERWRTNRAQLERDLKECERSVDEAIAPFRAMDIDIQQVLDKD